MWLNPLMVAAQMNARHFRPTLRWLGILLGAVLLALPVRAEPSTPSETVRMFYAWVLTHPTVTLPSKRERGQLAKVLSPALTELLRKASVTNDLCVKAAPRGSKPDILEGNLFVGNYEGATEVAWAELSHNDHMATVHATLLFVDVHFPKGHKNRAITWVDQVELRLEDNRWVVHDVTFPKGPPLTAALSSYVDSSTQTCQAGAHR